MTGVGSLSESFACSSPDPGGTRETILNSPWAYWSLPFQFFTTWDSVAGPGGPNAWKHFGRDGKDARQI